MTQPPPKDDLPPFAQVASDQTPAPPPRPRPYIDLTMPPEPIEYQRPDVPPTPPDVYDRSMVILILTVAVVLGLLEWTNLPSSPSSARGIPLPLRLGTEIIAIMLAAWKSDIDLGVFQDALLRVGAMVAAYIAIEAPFAPLLRSGVFGIFLGLIGVGFLYRWLSQKLFELDEADAVMLLAMSVFAHFALLYPGTTHFLY
jgi:hypothetical protein